MHAPNIHSGTLVAVVVVWVSPCDKCDGFASTLSPVNVSAMGKMMINSRMMAIAIAPMMTVGFFNDLQHLPQTPLRAHSAGARARSHSGSATAACGAFIVSSYLL
jgi:hypothetical protein